jgi:predicted NUDIX family phosphoesterase
MKKTELISVVKTDVVFKNTTYQEGIFAIDEVIINNIITHQEECERFTAEEDYTYQQIVSYIVFKYQNSLFLMQRGANSSEQKLKNKYSIGIGGHLRKSDIDKNLLEWGDREFHEEVSYLDSFTITPLAIINDQSNLIGKLHLGIVYLLEAESSNIHIKSELKSGLLIPLDQIKNNKYDMLESWSQSVIRFLHNECKTVLIR